MLNLRLISRVFESLMPCFHQSKFFFVILCTVACSFSVVLQNGKSALDLAQNSEIVLILTEDDDDDEDEDENEDEDEDEDEDYYHRVLYGNDDDNLFRTSLP